MNQEEQELLAEARELVQTDKYLKDELVCECMCVSIQDIKDFIGNRPMTIELLRELKLGSGCSSCLKNFKQWKHKI